MKRKRLRSALCCLIAALLMTTSLAYASPADDDITSPQAPGIMDEEDVTEATDVTVPETTEPDETTAATDAEETVPETTAPEVETWPGTAASGADYIEHIYRDEMTDNYPCQVTFLSGMPRGFLDSSYVVFKDDDGNLYRASMISDNHYEVRMYLAPGHYTIVDAGVYDNDELVFVKDIAEFTLADNNSTATVSFVMKNVSNIIQDSTGHFYDATGDETETETFYQTPYENIKMAKDGTLYYDVTHTGEGPGTMVAYGFATGDYDVVLKVTKSGVIGEAKAAISLDGGETYVGTTVIKDLVPTSVGLTLEFATDNDNDEFVEGDTFECSVIEAFNVTTIVSRNDVMVMCVGHPMERHELTITVLSSGGLGISKVSITDNRGKMSDVTTTIPADGILELSDGLTLIFRDLNGYTKDVTFKVNITSNDATVDYTPVYYLAAVAGVLVVVGFVILLLKKDKPATYHIHEYKWQQDEDKYK